ncbi:DUF5703 family protein [Citricoccus nitrophenolicus]|uniref:DUF5703 family protein n=1 Tax=Citricoccus nitrophenolicus TaxID=863575 RepID=UPI0031E6DCE3
MREQENTSGLDSLEKRQNWEYLVMTVAPGDSVAEARRRVVEHAEYGKWELQRTVLYRGGARRYWMRRRIMRVRSTLALTA